MSETSYRESHLQKGADYRESFATQPHLAMVWSLERRLLTRIVRERFPAELPTYLDFACGTGRILGRLPQAAASSTGVDVSPSMLQVARNTLTGVELIQADLTCTDTLGDRRFDLITAFRFFPNAEAQLRQDALTAIVRHLEPDGMLIFNNHRNRASLIRRIVVAGRRKIRTRGQKSQWGMSRQEAYELVASAGRAPNLAIELRKP